MLICAREPRRSCLTPVAAVDGTAITTVEGLGSPDHMAPIQRQGIVPDFLMDALGGDAEEDTADWRFYWAALDQLLAGDATPSFSMGSWADGRAVKPVIQLR